MKESTQIREKLEQKSETELQSIIDELDEKIVDRRPISNTMLNRCRKKAVAQSILDDRNSPSRRKSSSQPKPAGQQGLESFS